MKLEKVTLVFCSLGAALIVAAMVVKHVVVPAMPVEEVWSREDAEAHLAASMKYHNQSFDRNISSEELDASAQEFRDIEAKLDAARTRRSTLPRILHYAGLACVAIGGGCYIYDKANES